MASSALISRIPYHRPWGYAAMWNSYGFWLPDIGQAILDQIGLRIRRAGHKFHNLFIVIVGR